MSNKPEDQSKWNDDGEVVIGKSNDPNEHPDLEEERKRLGYARNQRGIALCLSGGGIRSATFSLGVIQSLAKLGWLEKFTYLSTVSGGGYLGSWLASWIRRKDLKQVVAALKGSGEPQEIRSLRASSNYLSPRAGVSADLLTLISTFLRNLFINWAILIPLLVVVTMLPLVNVGVAEAMMDQDRWGATIVRNVCIGFACILIIVALSYSASDVPDGNVHQTTEDGFRQFVFYPVLFASYLASLALLERISGNNLADAVWWRHGAFWLFVGIGIGIHSVGVLLGTYVVRRYRKHNEPRYSEPIPGFRGLRLNPWLKVPSNLVFVVISGAFAGAVAYAGMRLANGAYHAVLASKTYEATWSAAYSTLAVPFLLLCFFVGSVLHVALIRRNTDEGAREWWGKSGGTWLALAAAWIVFHVVCIWIPALLSNYGASVVGGSGALGGVLVAVVGYYSKNKPDPKQGKDLDVLEKLNIRVLDLISIAFIVALTAAVGLAAVDITADLEVPKELIPARYFGDLNTNMHWKWMGLLLAGLFALVFSWTAGVNAFSMHAMYGNRLARAYMGATRPVRPKRGARAPHAFTGFDPDDDLPMAETDDEREPKPAKTPLHVINTALNIVRASAEHLEWQERKAASFTVTPLRTGSRVTGYCRTQNIGGRAGVESKLPWGITIGRAMTISGAAAAPNMGFHSSRLVAIVMTFFNVRLGWWMRNPAPLNATPSAASNQQAADPADSGFFAAAADNCRQAVASINTWLDDRRRQKLLKQLCQTEPAFPLRALFAELTGDTREDSDYVYLSDGGHFENLGLYEMVRRECAEIVVVDAGCDPKYEYEDLERAIRIVRNDFGAEISIPDVPTAESIKATGKHYALGTVTYKNGVAGKILYIKPGLNDKEPLDVQRYAMRSLAKGEPFPHQSTGDQFFDEPQFESYRALGQHSVSTLPPLEVNSTSLPIRFMLAEIDRLEEVAKKKAEEDAKKGVVVPLPVPAVAKPVAAAAPEKKSGFGEVLSSLFSWDKLPGLLATALGSTALVSTLMPATTDTKQTVEQTTRTTPGTPGNLPTSGS